MNIAATIIAFYLGLFVGIFIIGLCSAAKQGDQHLEKPTTKED